MRKCPNCSNSELNGIYISKKVDDPDPSDYGSFFILEKDFYSNITNGIDFSNLNNKIIIDEKTMHRMCWNGKSHSSQFFQENSKYYILRPVFKNVYQDLICNKCGLVSTFIIQDTLDKIAFSFKLTDFSPTYFVDTFSYQINILFKDIDLMFEKCLDEDLSFNEVIDNKKRLKEYCELTIKNDSELNLKI